MRVCVCVCSLVSSVCISPAFSLREILATDPLMACVFSGILCVQRLFVFDPAWSSQAEKPPKIIGFLGERHVLRCAAHTEEKPGIGASSVNVQLLLAVFQRRL